MFVKFPKNRIRAHRRVLAVRTRLAFKRKRFFEIERDDCVPRKLQKKVAQSAHRDRVRGFALIPFIQIGMPRFHFLKRIGLESINQVVGFHAQTFAAAHLDVGALSIFIGKFNTELFARRG